MVPYNFARHCCCLRQDADTSQAAGRLQQMRDETYDMIEQIPQTIHKAERLLRTYDDSEKLKQLASKLYISILQGLAAILNWYKVKSAKKVFKSMIGRDSGAQEIQESLERLKKLETEIDGEASLQGHERLDEGESSKAEMCACLLTTHSSTDAHYCCFLKYAWSSLW